MEVYRLANRHFVSLDGMGGLYGTGRWHARGSLVTYAAESRALAVLERFIHDTHALSVPNLNMLTIYIPDELSFDQIFERDLPTGWDTTESTEQNATQEIGNLFLQSNSRAFLKVPSAIVPHEYNYILNPGHPDASQIKIIDSHPYFYDERYKRIMKTNESL